MPLILQYGVVNLLNAGLLLCQDEEAAVRSAAGRFGCALTPRPPHLPSGPALSTYLGTDPGATKPLDIMIHFCI